MDINKIAGWIFGLIVLTIGMLNMFLVHPIPGAVFLLVSLIYFPPIDAALKNKYGVSIPKPLKITLGIILIWFTLGISDLGDMID